MITSDMMVLLVAIRQAQPTKQSTTCITLTTVAAEAPGKAATAALRRTAAEDSFMMIIIK